MTFPKLSKVSLQEKQPSSTACAWLAPFMIKTLKKLGRMVMVCEPSTSNILTVTHCASDWQVMNEIALHRGSSPHLNTIDIFVDGQHLTEAVVCLFSYPDFKPKINHLF